MGRGRIRRGRKYHRLTFKVYSEAAFSSIQVNFYKNTVYTNVEAQNR